MAKPLHTPTFTSVDRVRTSCNWLTATATPTSKTSPKPTVWFMLTSTITQWIVAMAKAYEETEGTLADRLMAALVAGDRAGGDHRGRLAAGIRLAKPGVDGYWLELYVDKHDDAVAELAKKYAQLEHEARSGNADRR